jgi:hypothetical protein
MSPAEDVTTLAASIVVALADPLQIGGGPIAGVQVRLQGRSEKPIQDFSGYYVFVDLPVGTYRVEVAPTPEQTYLPEVVPAPPALPISVIDPPSAFPRTPPLVTVPLRPRPTYPFSAEASLVRGTVRKGSVPLADAKIVITVGDPMRLGALWSAYETAQGGGFVFAFRFTQPKSSPQAITLQATHPVEGVSLPFPAQVIQNGTQHKDIVYP